MKKISHKIICLLLAFAVLMPAFPSNEIQAATGSLAISDLESLVDIEKTYPFTVPATTDINSIRYTGKGTLVTSKTTLSGNQLSLTIAGQSFTENVTASQERTSTNALRRTPGNRIWRYSDGIRWQINSFNKISGVQTSDIVTGYDKGGGVPYELPYAPNSFAITTKSHYTRALAEVNDKKWVGADPTKPYSIDKIDFDYWRMLTAEHDPIELVTKYPSNAVSFVSDSAGGYFVYVDHNLHHENFDNITDEASTSLGTGGHVQGNNYAAPYIYTLGAKTKTLYRYGGTISYTSTDPIPEPDPDPTPWNPTADFDILPGSTIAYRDSFSFRPKNMSPGTSCSYISHTYKIERDGNSVSTGTKTSISAISSYSTSTYPWVVGVGTHTISIQMKTSCGTTGWLSSKTLTVNGPANNNPPDFQLGWVAPNQQSPTYTTVTVGTVLDLIYLDATVSDPDGDAVYWEGFDFTDSAAWAKTIPNISNEYMNGYHNITMDTLGFFTVKGTFRDQFGATTTRSTSINVVPPNPVAVITGSTDVVEGRALATPLSSSSSYSPIGRTINHALDLWTNKKSIYTTIGTETVKLDVFDSSGLRSLSPATHTITVKPDLPPVPRLQFIPTTLRNTTIVFTNSSYSPDGDAIVANSVSYRYDTNNDGVYSEAATNVNMDSNQQFTYKPTKVGNYQFAVTVREDYGKQATSYFVLNVTNDNPQATFTLKGEIAEPTYVPPVSVTSATLMGSTWNNTSLLDTTVPKRWVIHPTGSSLVATTDTERFSSISSNVISDVQFDHYMSYPCDGSCHWLTRRGGYTFYLGNNIMAGYSNSYGQTDIWGPGNVLIKSITYLTLTSVDIKNNLAYGYRQAPNYEWYWVSMRITDLVNANSTIVPYILNVLVPDGANYYQNPYSPKDVYSNRNDNNIESAIDAKANDWGNNTINSYQFGSYSAYRSVSLSSLYMDPYIHSGTWKDQLGNLYAYWTPTHNPWQQTSKRDLVKLNNITGQIEWEIEFPYGNSSPIVDVVGDGKYIVVTTRNSSGHNVAVRDAFTGQLISQKNIASPNTGSFMGIYNETILFKDNGVIYAYDYFFNVKWSMSSFSPMGFSKGLISKDGYLYYFERVYSHHDSYSYYYDVVLKLLNLTNGTTINTNIKLHQIDDYSSQLVTKMELIDDSTLYLKYSYAYYGRDSGYNNTTHYSRVIKTSPLVPDTVVANEAFASGQLTSPTSTSNQDAEFYFDLKFNNATVKKPAGFGFRIQNNKNMYRVEIFKDKVVLVKYVNAIRTVISSVTYPSSADYTTYKIRVVGNSIRVYAAGTPIIDTTDSQFTIGLFGPYSAMQKSEFKNVKYKILSGGGSSTFVENVALVDSSVQHTTTFVDLENDPRIHALTAWRYEHTAPNKFLNAGDGKSGLSAKHNLTVASPYLSFDRVGTYRITYSAWDDPNPTYLYPNNTFASFRKKSDPYAELVVVHRKPISNFAVSIKADKTVGWVDYSYDPDRWLSASNYSTEATGINYLTTKGILEKKFYYVSPSGVSKSIQLVTPTEVGVYTVGMAVKDEYGAWSDWMEKTVTVATAIAPDYPPTSVFTATPATAYRGTTITIDSGAYDAENGTRANLPHVYYVRKDSGTEVLQSTVRTAWTHVFSQIGSYTFRQVVSDAKGQTAQTTRVVNVINRKPAAVITTPASTNQYAPTQFSTVRPAFNWTFTDPDSDAQTRYQIKIYRYGGYLLHDSGVITSNLKTWTPSVDLPENQNMYAIVTVNDGYEWSANSSAKYFYIQTNVPPVADFDWSPRPLWEGDVIHTINESYDPDGDSLTYLWTITQPNGVSYSSTKANPIIMSVAGSYSVRLAVSDGVAQSTITHTIRAELLVLEANVSHTELWLAHHEQQGHETVVNPKSFYTGEIFIVSAYGSLADTSRVTASLEAIGQDGNPIVISVELAVAGQANHFLASLYDPILSSLTGGLPDGLHQIKFRIEYTNGMTKEVSIPIQIIGHAQGAVNVHRRQ